MCKDVAPGQVVWVESAIREQRFPLCLGDLFRELLTVLLCDKLIDFLLCRAVVTSQVLIRRVNLRQCR